MIPLVDLHCHLLAGLDDGPRTPEDALEMCRLACAEGVAMVAALAHQNERYPDVTPDRIRAATRALADELRRQNVPLTVFPCAEVMAYPGMESAWQAGAHLTVGDRGKYLLLEMPHGLFVDLRQTAVRLRQQGVRLVLAHPERQPELLHEPENIEALVGEGCLVQVSSGSITDPATREDQRALRDWFRRGLVHVLGSDGHSPRRRPPRLADAYRQVVRWTGAAAADRIAHTNGLAVLQGLPLNVPAPLPRRPQWLRLLW